MNNHRLKKAGKSLKVGDMVYWHSSGSKNPKWNGWKFSKVASILEDGYAVYTIELHDADEYCGLVDIIQFKNSYKEVI